MESFNLMPSHLNPFETILALLTIVVVGARFKEGLKGATILLQVSIMLLKMTKFYFDTHPDASKKLAEGQQKLDNLYKEHVERFEGHVSCLGPGEIPKTDDVAVG